MISELTIVSGSPFFSTDHRAWLPPTEWKSLSQWWDLGAKVRLLKPELVQDEIPAGWLEVPESISAEKLCSCAANRWIRRYQVQKRASKDTTGPGFMLFRMPYYEAAWCYALISPHHPKFAVEIHGDWETAVLEEDCHTVYRKLTRRFRAYLCKRTLARMARESEFVVAIGNNLVQKYVPKHKSLLVTTNHLLSENDFCPIAAREIHQPPRILFVGDMQRRKGLHVLFQALSILKSAGHPFRMVMVGSGPMVDKLEVYAEREGFAQMVEFLGSLPHGEALYAQFRTSDLFVLPSVAAEGVPRVSHEAMAFGCPVVASDIGSIRWQLRDGAGIVVPPGNPALLADSMVKVFKDGALRENLRNKGYLRSLDHTFERQKATLGVFVAREFSAK